MDYGRVSQIVMDEILALPRVKCGSVIGRPEVDTRAGLNRMLALVLGIGD